jgi:hypothetical protein
LEVFDDASSRLSPSTLQFAAITWLGTPVVKAYNTSRTPDHPEEQTFLDENGFVKICLPMLFLFIVDTFSL